MEVSLLKLKFSCFSPTVLRKDITRFAPLWAIYSVCLLMILLGLFTEKAVGPLAVKLADSLYGMCVINSTYAGLCAMFLFGDLFSPRRCNAFHALPLRREGWFLTHTAAGLLFSLVPNLLFVCIFCIRLGAFFYIAFLWLAVMLLQYLFFFGVAVFSAMCAGNRLGMIAVCGILNYGALLVLALATNLYLPVLEGFLLDFGNVLLFVPMVPLLLSPLQVSYHPVWGLIWHDYEVGLLWYLVICAAVGLVFAGLGLLLYRKRKLEYAGDLLAVKWLSPVFAIVYSLFVAMLFYYPGKLVAPWLGYVFLGIGLTVGYFTGRMFLERKVHVFKGRNFLKFGIFATVFALSLVLTWWDPLGLSQFVPDVENIRSVRLYDDSTRKASSGNSIKLTDPEDLEAVTEAHQYLLDRLDKSGDSDITIQYTLNSGLMVTRTYAMNPGGGAGQMLKPYFSRWEYIFDTDNWYWVTTHVRAVSIERDLLDSLLIGDRQELDTHWYPAKYHLDTGEDPKLIMALLEAVRKDCDAGNLAQLNGGGYIGYDTAEIAVYYTNGDVATFQYSGKAVNTRPVVNDLFKQATPVTE